MPKKSGKKSRPIYSLKTLLIYFTVIGTVLLIGRILISETHHYAFLWWNLVLAAVPLVCAVHANKTKNVSLFICLTTIWLFFYPNAPYILTDYIHLGNAYSVNYLLLDFIIITIFALDGVLIGFASLEKVLDKLTHQFSKVVYFPALITISVLTGLGLYIGRYLRFNSWEIVTNPLKIYNVVTDDFLNIEKLPFVLLIVVIFAAFHYFAYLLYFKLFDS